MNSNTRKDFQEFIEAVKRLANAIEELTRDDMFNVITVETLNFAAEKLKAQLDKDETIIE